MSVFILLGADDFVLGEAPLNSNMGVVPGNAVLRFGVVELVALILEHRVVLQDHIAVRKALGDKELALILVREFNGDISAKSGAIRADIDRNIQYPALHHAYQFGLRVRLPLEVQTTQHAPKGQPLLCYVVLATR